MNYVEIVGKTREEAVEKALLELNAKIEDVTIDVEEQKPKGFFGFLAKKELRVKVTLKETKKTDEDLEDFSFASKGFSLEDDKKDDSKILKESVIDENSKEMAKKFLEDIFTTLEINAEINISENEGCLCIGVTGDEASRLIGRRGESLDSLQMLTGLAVNRDRDKYVKVLLDIENYRAKREESLIKYANKMARQSAKQRRVIKLEPMNPYERRIIHSALQSDRYVKTYSEGKDPYRKIVIEPKYK
ncbi:RNA-binding cell elongation regulator Jag/EloR [Proteocatella sphenisci]|uniref:RNA-binding cell elongation regulator Jag/EloR n=1 Tax=Proteocatella sphenisci TaxID=181070 RepID=UPI000491BF11|nr:RNA-binding cell elongation regulator Jag/EloR [Proteocatella sphenisci]